MSHKKNASVLQGGLQHNRITLYLKGFIACIVLAIMVLHVSAAETETLTLQQSSSGYDGCEDVMLTGTTENYGASDQLRVKGEPGTSGWAASLIRFKGFHGTDNGTYALPSQINSVTFCQGLDSYSRTEDTWIDLNNPNSNYGGDDKLFAGSPQSGQTGIATLIRFDDLFGDDAGQVPLTSEITYAYLRLTRYHQSNPNGGAPLTWLRPMLSDWEEGTTTGLSQEGSSCANARNYSSDGNYASYPEDAWGTDGSTHDGPVWSLDAQYSGSPVVTQYWDGNSVLGNPPDVAVFKGGLNGYTGTRDTTVRKENPNYNYGASAEISFGTPLAEANGRGTLIGFDGMFGAGAYQVPSDAGIVSAKLRVYAYTIGGTQYPDYAACAMMSEWVEGTASGAAQEGSSCGDYRTYSSSPSGDDYWGTAGTAWYAPKLGVDYDYDIASFTASPTSAGCWVEWDITDIVSDWQSGELANNGLLLRTHYDSWNYLKCYSSDYTTDPNLRPELVVEYYDFGSVFEPIEFDVTDMVKAWQNGDLANYGMYIGCDDPDTQRYYSSEYSGDPCARPMLVIEYAGDSIVYRQGVDGYSGTEDTLIYTSDTTTNLQYGGSSTISKTSSFLTRKRTGLIRFTDIFGSGTSQISPNAEIDEAILDLTAYYQSDPGSNGVDVWAHRMFTDWEEGTGTGGTAAEGESCPEARYYRSDGNYAAHPEDAWGTAGVAVDNGPDSGVDFLWYTNDPYRVTLVDTDGSFSGYGTEFRSTPLDITDIATSWQQGDLDNYGLYFGCLYWDQRSYYSSEYFDPNVRPAFRLNYKPAKPIIVNATLDLYVYNVSGYTKVNVSMMNTPWTEGAADGSVHAGSSCMSYRCYRSDGQYGNYPYDTWNDDGSSHDGPVEDYDRDALNCHEYVESIGWISVDVTPMVQQWYNSNLPDDWGFYLWSDNGGDASFYSSEYTTDPCLRPKLTIEYLSGRDAPLDDNTPSAIVIPRHYSYGEVDAATKLQAYLEMITDTEVPICARDDDPCGAIILGDHPTNATVKSTLLSNYPLTSVDWIAYGRNHDAFAVVTDGTNLRLVGNCDRATVYAALDWLETLGVRWLIPDPNGMVIPSLGTITIDPNLAEYQAPGMALRPRAGRGGSEGCWETDYYFRSSRYEPGPSYGPYSTDMYISLGDGHDGYSRYLPKATYCEDHPEWYALIGDVRGGEPWQVCFTDPNAAHQYAENALADVQRELAKGVPIERLRVVLSPRDAGITCECSACQAILTAGGNDTDLVVHFANMVASEMKAVYPDLHFMVMAYWEHFSPPVNTTIDSSIIMEVAFYTTISGIDYSKPMLNATYNTAAADAFCDYETAGVGLSAYTYYGHFRVFTPWPMLTQIAYDVSEMAATEHWTGMESEIHGHWATQGPGFYLFNQLLWDPCSDVSSVMSDYYTKAYGSAADDIEDYFDTLQDAADNYGSDMWGYLWQMPDIITSSAISTCDSYIASARNEISSADSATAWRIKLVCDAWDASAETLEAMSRYCTSTPQAGDIDYMVDRLQDAWDYAQTVDGGIAFENNVVETYLKSLYLDPLSMPLMALEPGEYEYYEQCYKGGPSKFHAETWTGFGVDPFGSTVAPGNEGIMVIPVAALPCATITEAQVKIKGSSTIDAKVYIIDCNDVEHEIASSYSEASAWVDVPSAYLSDNIKIKICRDNNTGSTGYGLTYLYMNFTVGQVPTTYQEVTFRNGLDGYTGTEDVLLYKNAPNNNYGASTSFRSGHPDTTLNPSLLAFKDIFGDEPNRVPLNDNITEGPDAVIIDSAILHLTRFSQAQGGDEGMTWLSPMYTDWEEGAVWGNTQEGSSCMNARYYRGDGDYASYPEDAWGTDGTTHDGPVWYVDHDPTDSRCSETIWTDGTIGYEGSYSYVYEPIDLDVTELVQAWHSGELDNYGMYVGCYDWDRQIFYSSESDACDVARPTLIVNYGYFIPGQAEYPSPNHSATSVSTTTDLSWTAGSDTVVYDVYFGTDSTPDETELQGEQSETSYDPGTLSSSTTYYWRIDSKNKGFTTTGDVWSFTTEP